MVGGYTQGLKISQKLSKLGGRCLCGNGHLPETVRY